MDGTPKETSDLDASKKEEFTPIKRSFIINKDNELRYDQRPQARKSKKKILIIIVFLIILATAGGFFGKKYHVLTKIRTFIKPTPIATPVPAPSSSPLPIQPVLERSEWSFEVLNGSGASGLAKKVADRIQALGYSVVKTGNADKSSYEKTEILVKSGMKDNIDLVIADLKDAIKIASVAGELKEGTASARIIIGKDSNY